MGIAASWISVKGLSRGEFLARLGLAETAYTHCLAEYWFDRYEVGGVAVLPGGRQLFVSTYADLAIPAVAEVVSKGAELLMCSMEEHVMFSEAYSYTDGKFDWLIRHDCDRTPTGIETDGAPPAILREALAKADKLDRTEGGADYHFDVPIDVAASIGGYRPVENIPGFDNIVTLVERTEHVERKHRKRRGFWRWLVSDA